MLKPPAKGKVRRATRTDIPALIKLNIAAYPVLADDNIVWGEAHLASHLRIFPQGQFVAVVKGKIVGAAATWVVDLGPDTLRNHTWSGITDSGYFNNHDLDADTLYGADIYVHPDARGVGVGAAFYDARRKLCKKLNKRRILPAACGTTRTMRTSFRRRSMRNWLRRGSSAIWCSVFSSGKVFNCVG
ncbi:MAG: GNAT family N-acetyltransferase [Candidatus Synoicihabitans palmerolidicus]|nr:GNAT family N-acetyltransferase [Candidatus Synoicihabitans palmerolidicus]